MALFSKLNIKERSYRTPFFQSQMTQQQTRVTVVHLVALKMSSEEKVDEIPVRKPGSKKATAKKKGSRRVLSLEEKYKVVKVINSGKKQAEVAQRFDPPLTQSTVATIVRSKKE